jgi:predicted DNA-binding transcriptional regulator AlpA
MTEVVVFTMPQVAERCGINRTTLKRMEDRGVIPQARWVTSPFRARVYTEEEVQIVEARVKAYMQRYVARRDGEGLVVNEADIVNASELTP